jgi:four helix bundle protein
MKYEIEKNNKNATMKTENIVMDKSFAFAVRIVKLYQFLGENKKDFVLSKQLLRSGTSIGANVREAHNAESKPDSVHKMGIAQKEADEALYWLELLFATGILSKREFESIHNEAEEILKNIRSIILTSKQISPLFHHSYLPT